MNFDGRKKREVNGMKGIKMPSKLSLFGAGSAVAAILLATAIIGGATSPASARPEFAAATGKPCGACHTNPGGGGKLTAAGEKYKASKK
jgi:mono/diheme cytochrome c family protein